MEKEMMALTAKARAEFYGQPMAVPANPTSAKSSSVDLKN